MPISQVVRILRGRGSGALRALAIFGLGIVAVSLSTNPLQTLVANGDTRTLSFAHIHTKETLTVTFKRVGRYDADALKKLNWYLRDWRNDETTNMDPHLFDLLWEIHREVNASGPITIVSAYRSPNTNNMLRARGRGVARNSQHTVGKAIDFFIPGSDLAQMRAIGLRLQRGGVGYYPGSGAPFIHVDTGGVRHWPRMTRQQLARIFPDGRTVHIPSDGKRMPGYSFALAEIQSRNTRPTAVASLAGGSGSSTTNNNDRNASDGDTLAAGGSSGRRAIPTATALTNPSPPAPEARPSLAAKQTQLAAAAPPMPLSRPSEPGDGTTLPAAFASRADRAKTRVLSYAAEPEAVLSRFGPIPATHARLLLAAAPAEPLTDDLEAEHELETDAAGHADAAHPAPALLAARMLVETPDLHHPELMALGGLMAPVRVALRVRFRNGTLEGPATVAFEGPAVVALQTVAFGRGGGVITGSVATRTN